MPFNRGVYLYEVLRLVSPQPCLHSTLQQKILLSPPKGLRPSEGKVGARVSHLLELVLATRHGLSSGFSELIGEGGKRQVLARFSVSAPHSAQVQNRYSAIQPRNVDFSFWETDGVRGNPLPLTVYWNHRFSGKSRSNLWGSAA